MAHDSPNVILVAPGYQATTYSAGAEAVDFPPLPTPSYQHQCMICVLIHLYYRILLCVFLHGPVSSPWADKLQRIVLLKFKCFRAETNNKNQEAKMEETSCYITCKHT